MAPWDEGLVELIAGRVENSQHKNDHRPPDRELFSKTCRDTPGQQRSEGQVGQEVKNVVRTQRGQWGTALMREKEYGDSPGQRRGPIEKGDHSLPRGFRLLPHRPYQGMKCITQTAINEPTTI